MESNQFLKFISLLCMLLLLTACFPIKHWPEERAQVLEVETNKPLEGVIVVAFWKGSIGVAGTQTTCYHVESATTDAQGRFVIPAYNDGFRQGFTAKKYTVLRFYKPGYKKYVRPDGYTYTQKKIYRMEAFKGTREERLKYLKKTEQVTRCNVESEKKKVRLPLLKSLYHEAKNLSVTKEEQKIVDGLLYMLESMELGEDAAFKRMSERWEK